MHLPASSERVGANAHHRSPSRSGVPHILSGHSILLNNIQGCANSRNVVSTHTQNAYINNPETNKDRYRSLYASHKAPQKPIEADTYACIYLVLHPKINREGRVRYVIRTAEVDLIASARRM